MESFSVEEIDSILENRLRITREFHKKILLSDNIIDDRNIFLNYYLDFASGIEFLIRQILIVKYVDVFLIDKLQIKEDSNPKFYDINDVSNLIQEIFPRIKWIQLKQFCYEKCFDFKETDFPNKMNNYIITIDDFKCYYPTAKKTRNKIAHGFELSGLSFNKKTLFAFVFVYYVLFNVLKKIRD